MLFLLLKQFGYLSLHIGSDGHSVKVFRLFSMYLKGKAFKYLKNQSFYWQFQITFHMYLDVGRDYDDDYDDAYYYE